MKTFDLCVLLEVSAILLSCSPSGSPLTLPSGDGGTGGSFTTINNANSSCNMSISPDLGTAAYTLNSSVSATVIYNGSQVATQVCIQILHYDASQSSYVKDNNNCGAYPYTTKLALSSVGQFEAVASVYDSNGNLLCPAGSGIKQYTVGAGQGSSGAVTINSYHQSVLTNDLYQYFELYIASSSAPTAVDLNCGGSDFGGTVSYSQLNAAAGTGIYQTNFFVFDGFPLGLVGQLKGCAVTATVGTATSPSFLFTLLPQIKTIVYADNQPQASTGSRSLISAWGSFGANALMRYNCDNGTSSSYSGGLSKTDSSILIQLDPNAVGSVCHFFVEEIGGSAGTIENTTAFNFSP